MLNHDFSYTFWIFWYGLACLVGLLMGSFVGVVAHRLPRALGLVDGPSRGNLLAPPSYCPACGSRISTLRLVPLLGYLASGGACAHCKVSIPVRYPLLELAGAGIAGLCLLRFGVSGPALLVAIFGWALLALSVIDADTGFLPDALTLPLAAIGLAASAAGAGLVTIEDSAFGAVAGFVTFSAISHAYLTLRKTEGLGLGDAKLLGAIGAFVGLRPLPFVVFLAAAATLAFLAIRHVATGKDLRASTPIPFGPGLCLAGFLAAISGLS